MAIVTINDENLTNIAAAIREKNGSTDTYKPADMADAIAAIQTGGGDFEPVLLSGDCSYACQSAWNQFLSYASTNDITSASSMFRNNTTIERVPFTINLATRVAGVDNMFNSCFELKKCPTVIGNINPPTGNYSGTMSTAYMFYACYNLREIPNDFFYKLAGEAYWEAAVNYQAARTYMFNSCYSLRKLPDISMLKTPVAYYNSFYQYAFQSCYALDEITNIPVVTNTTYTSNAFTTPFSNCNRVKEITFETQEDGTPYVAKWQNQTLDVSYRVGYGGYSGYAGEENNPDSWNQTKYNSGISIDKRVYDDATYQALKDDPDWFASDINYSRYNKTSAINTINSLPDCSATGSNTIKFNGAAGTNTDGGAINTLTEEEIAVATAKGWTVMFA